MGGKTLFRFAGKSIVLTILFIAFFAIGFMAVARVGIWWSWGCQNCFFPYKRQMVDLKRRSENK